MINCEWKDVDHACSYYYDTCDGRIVGQVYNLAHTKIWGAKLMNDESLGIYISFDTAKKALERHFDIQNRTLIENV